MTEEVYGKSEAFKAFPNVKLLQKIEHDMMIYGTGILFETKRKWFNPMRYIKGKYKIIRVHPRKLCMYLNKR